MSFSKMMKKVSAVGAFGLMGLLGSDNAEAAFFNTATDGLTVTATVQSACSVDTGAGTLAFGNYDLGSLAGSNAAVAAATITTSCSPGVAWQVRMNSTVTPGTFALAGQDASNAGQSLAYTITATPAGGAATPVVAGTTTFAGLAATPASIALAGALPSIAPALPVYGAYQDLVTVTMDY